MQAVLDLERSLGFEPLDVSADKCGYDILSKSHQGQLRFIEVKGRTQGAPTITVSKNEILTALNKTQEFILALVLISDEALEIHYLQNPFERQPDFDACSVNYELDKLLHRAKAMKL
ncbi:MAG: DUF3883 domain-containing protein [Deinococcales bacterium]